MIGFNAIFFESLVNFYQGFMITFFLMNTLEKKSKYSKFMSYTIGIFPIFALLEIQLFSTSFESYGIVILLLIVNLIAMIVFEGTKIQRIIYGTIAFVISIFVTILSGLVVGVFANISYVDMVSNSSVSRNVSIIVAQVLMLLFFVAIISLIKNAKLGRSNSLTIMIVILSVLASGVAISILELLDERSVINAFIAIVMLVFMIITSIIMYIFSEKSYYKTLEQQLQLNTLLNEKHNIEEIKRNVEEVEQVRHELNKVMLTINELLSDCRIEDAKRFLSEFQREELDKILSVEYTSNRILNYLINQKMSKCNNNNLDMKIIVNGIIDGIEDVDLHNIFSNAVDNAIEAACNADKKYIDISISASENAILFEINNTIDAKTVSHNPMLKTTKRDKIRHGHGIENMKRAAAKYSGSVEYNQYNDELMKCRIIVLKKFVPK